MAHNLSRVARAIYLIPPANSLVTLSSLNALSHMATNCLSSHGAPHPPQIRLKLTKSESLSVGKVYLGPDEAASRKRHPLRPHPQGHGRVSAIEQAAAAVGRERRKSWRLSPLARGASRQEVGMEELGGGRRHRRIG